MVTGTRTAYQQLLQALEYLGSVAEVRARNRAICDPTASFSILSRSKRKTLDAGEMLAAHRLCDKQSDLLHKRGYRLPPIQELYETEPTTAIKQQSTRKVIELPRREQPASRTPVQREATEEDYERIIHQLSSNPNVNELVNVQLPELPGERDYLDHQRIGIRWLLTPRPNDFAGGLLADQPGLGKTLSSLAAARLTDLPIFVVTIASALENWRREVLMAGIDSDLVTICSWDSLHKWTHDTNPPVAKESKSKTKKPKKFGRLVPTGFLAEQDFIFIGDEIHACQTLTSQRCQRTIAITHSEHCRGGYLLSGTPMPNAKPKNIYPLLLIMRHPLAMDRNAFEIRYCDAKLKSIRIGKGEKQQERHIWDDNGAKNLDELAKLIAPYILLRYTRDCIDLPPIEKLLHECDLTAADRKIYEDELKEMRGRFQDRVQREEVMDNPAVALDQLRQAASRAKVRYTAEMALHLMAQGDQVILFTWFKETARRLSQELDCDVISGDVDPKKRQPIIDRFESGQKKVIVCTFGAGGTAINLIAGNWVLSVERPYVPGIEEQSFGRAWRIGQTKRVTVMWLRAFEVDEIVDAMVQRKSDIIDLVIRGKRKTLRGIGKSAATIAKAILPALLEA